MVGRPDQREDLRPAARRFKAGHQLAIAAALLVVVGAAAKAAGAPSWLVAAIWAVVAAGAVLAAVWMVPTYVRFRRLARQKTPRV